MDTALWLISKILWFVLRPNTLALLAACLGVLLLLRQRRRAGGLLAVLGLSWFVLVLGTPLPSWATLPLEDRFPRPAAEPARIDGIVVLGGAVDTALTEARGLPALNGAAERMTEPVALLRRHPQARLVFTGGQGSPIIGALSEADVARQLWLSMGLLEKRLIFEAEARNTHENATLTFRLVQPQPGETWLLITSASHMPRSVGVFRHAGWVITPWPVNYTTGHDWRSWYDAPFGARLGQVEWAIREWIGLAVYRLLGRTDAFFPAPQYQ